MAELILDFSRLHLHGQGDRRRVSAQLRVACEPHAPGAREAPRSTLHLSFSPFDRDQPPLPSELLEALQPFAGFLVSQGRHVEHRITVRVHVGPEASPETERAADFLLDLPWEALGDENGPLFKGMGRARVERLLLAARSAAAAPHVLESFSPGVAKSLDLPLASPPPATRGILDDLSPPTPLCLNAWFPDHPADPIRLPVGIAAVLRVNLGPPRDDAAASEALPPDVIQALHEVPFIDVLILCAGADIQPLRRRLVMPPDPALVLEFALTPSRPGALEIQIVLLVHNEPIHRMLVPAEAIPSASTSATASGSIPGSTADPRSP